MEGFDPKWRDQADYVLGITKAIWEDRGIRSLEGFYGEDLIVRSPSSVIKGNGGIVAATLATLAEFPDRELLGEDVIWTLTGEDSFLSSHRLYCTATHSGAGMYGPPTGRQLAYRILADCWCRGNAVQDEWLVRDQGAIVLQMGEDIPGWTRRLIAREGGPEACVAPYRPEIDIAGPYDGVGDGAAPSDALGALLGDAMAGDFSAFAKGYDRAARLAYPCHEAGRGPEDAVRFWMSLRNALPSAEFVIHHAIGRLDDPDMPPRAAIRWSMDGRHDGYGRFGPPTGATLHVMGITHAEFGPRGLAREWTLIDDTAVWKQILLSTGDV
ncbi:nuclear transport factor 2 family protein [Aestuariibius sp. 2305UL40-4]|uniref:nuclear transport factor 2 family protein n=1 Tax=Aestuariibius violaceus TaxID=3234132 RepID=UPI00345E2265